MANDAIKPKPYSRPLYYAERVYIIYNELCPPFANQIVLEGHGTLDSRRWEAAVAQACEANPGTRLILKGHWIFSRWVDSGITPRVREVDGSRWDGCGPVGAPFEQEPLPYRTGPTCEVVLLQGDPLRVVFRSHHGVMDGRATLFWAEEIFRVLRGEAPLGSDSRLTELEIAKGIQKKGRTPPPHEFVTPVGKAYRQEPGVVWRRLHLKGRYRNLVPQCAKLLAQAAWELGEGKVRFGVSVDLRARKPGLRSTGNLTNLIYLEPTPSMSVGDIAQDLSNQLEQRKDGMLYWGDRLVRYAPLALIRYSVKKEIADNHKRGLYRTSGLLSNPGKLSLERLACDTFQTQTGFFIPPSQESMPLFIAMAGTSEAVELIFSMSRVLADEGRLEAIMEHIRKGLVPA